MRAALGLIFLFGVLLVAAGWQSGRSRAAQTKREAQGGAPLVEKGRETTLLVLGALSGADPIPGSEHLPQPEEDEATVPEEPAWRPDPELPSVDGSYEPDWSYVVQDGDVLSRICSRHYGTAKRTLVDAVARYNNLDSANDIRAGDPVLLPDRALLGE